MLAGRARAAPGEAPALRELPHVAAAVGFESKRNGERSYDPRLCAVAVAARVPESVIENRFDGALFSEDMVLRRDELQTQYTISVPFECVAELKGFTEDLGRWNVIDDNWSFSREDSETREPHGVATFHLPAVATSSPSESRS